MAKINVDIVGKDKTKKAFISVKGSTDKLEKSFNGLKVGIAGLIGAAGLGALSAQVLEVGDKIGKMSAAVGIAAGELQGLQFAAEQSGVGADTLNKSIKKLSINIGKGKDGVKKYKDTFDKLGISLVDSEGIGRSTESIFLDLADALGGMGDTAQAAKISNDLFGESGVSLLNMFAGGSEGIQGFSNQLKSVGGVIHEKSIKAFESFNDSLNLISKAALGNFSVILSVVMPQLTKLADILANNLGKGTRILSIGLAYLVQGFKLLVPTIKLVALQIIDGMVGAFKILSVSIEVLLSKLDPFSDVDMSFKDISKAVEDLNNNVSKNSAEYDKSLVAVKKNTKERLALIDEMTIKTEKLTDKNKKNNIIKAETGKIEKKISSVFGADFTKKVEQEKLGQISNQNAITDLFTQKNIKERQLELTDKILGYEDKIANVKGVQVEEQKSFSDYLNIATTEAATLFKTLGGGILDNSGAGGQRLKSIIQAGSIQEGMANLVFSNEKVQEALGKVMDAIFELIDPILDLLAPVLESFIEVFREFKPLFEPLIPFLRQYVIPPLKTLAIGIKKVADNLKVIKDAIEGFKGIDRVFETWIPFLEDYIIPPLKELAEGMKKLGENLNFVKDALENFSPKDPFQEAQSITSGGLFGFAKGGNVSAHKPVIVGESGPEIFRPSSRGTIIPNNKIGGGIIVNIFDGSGQKIDELESNIRVEINQRANRFDQFPALAI